MDISNLPLDKKKEIARALWTKKEFHKAHALHTWKPWTCRHGDTHTSQEEPFLSTARRVLICGGNRSGKTEVAAALVAHMVQGTHPTRKSRIPCIVKIVAPGFKLAKQSILPKLMRFIPKSFIKSTTKNERGVIVDIECINGSVINVMSNDQDADQYESFDADIAWFDEPPREELWEAMRRGLIDRSGIEIFSMTPLKEPWIYDKFYLPALNGDLKTTEVFEISTECNPYISEEEIEELKTDYDHDEVTLASRLQGKFRFLSGLVYKFNPKIHKITAFQWPAQWPVWMCLDPHPKKAHAVSWVGVDPKGRRVIINELKAACTISELAMKIRTLESKHQYRVVDRLVDTSIKAIDRKDQKKLLAQHGIRCRFAHKYDRLLPGIEKVQQAMHPIKNNQGDLEPELYVFDSCEGHIKEFMTYVWDKDKQVPKKLNDDYMDNIRYIEDINPSFNWKAEYVSYAPKTETYGHRAVRRY